MLAKFGDSCFHSTARFPLDPRTPRLQTGVVTHDDVVLVMLVESLCGYGRLKLGE